MDDTRTTLVGLATAVLLAVLFGLIAQLFVDEQRVERSAALATYASVTQTVDAVTLTAQHIVPIATTEIVTPVTPAELSSYELLYTLAREEWSLVAYEPFDNNERVWSVGGRGERSRGQRGMHDGLYRWEVTAIADLTWASAPIEVPFDDFYISAEMQKRRGSVGGQNLTFRFNDGDNYIDFGICENGMSYQVWRQYLGEWEELVECVTSDAIRPNEVNTLAVLAQTDLYHLYANGQYLATIEDDLLQGGSVGVSIDLDDEQTNVFEFDNFEVRAPLNRFGR